MNVKVKHLAAATLLALGACHSIAPAQQRWLELESDHFVLRTDVDEEEARAALVSLEQTREVFLRALPWSGSKPPPARPLTVVELADLAELHQFTKPEVDGFVSDYGMAERVVVLSAERETAQQPVLNHELAHAVAGLMLRRQPAWFAEGIACFLQNTRKDPDAARDLVGEIDEERVQWLAQHTAMSAEQVLSIPGAAELPDRDGARFESTAYELVFALFNQRNAGLAAYMRMLAHGDDPGAAFAAAFPDLTPARLDELARAAQTPGVHFAKLGVPLLPYQGKLEVRAMTPVAIHAQLAALYALSPGLDDRTGAKARAEAELKLALQADAHDPEALAVRFYLGMPREQARALAQEAVALHPDSFRAQLLLARLLGEMEQRSPGIAQERLQAAEAAAKLAPEEPRALAMHAAALAEQHRGAEALPIAQRAVALDPSDPNGLAILALAQAESGMAAEARASLSRAAERATENAPREFLAMLRELGARLDREQQASASQQEAAAMLAKQQPSTTESSTAKPSAAAVPRADVEPGHALVKLDRPPVRGECGQPGPAFFGKPKSKRAEVRAIIEDDGKLLEVQKVSGDEAAVQAIRQYLSTCSYEPGRRGGQPVRAALVQIFTFP